MKHPANTLTIRVVGSFAVLHADGSDRSPKGRRAKGLLALLALTPHHKLRRAALQDKLWSNREPEQGAGSLRQALSEIRRALGDAHGCVLADRHAVSLDATCVAIIKDLDPSMTVGENVDAGEFLLEDLDVPDPEFENWLRDQRSQFASSRANAAGSSRTTVAASLARHSDSTQSPNYQLQLLVDTRSVGGPNAREQLLADSLTDIVSRTVSELGNVEIVYARSTGGADSESPATREGELATVVHPASLTLRAQVVETGPGDAWRVSLSSTINDKLVWSSGGQLKNDRLNLTDLPILRDLNQVASEVYRNFSARASTGGSVGEERYMATLLCQQGIQHLFRLGTDNLRLADDLFRRAFDIEPRGIYLAWRAYLRNYLLTEFVAKDRPTVMAEAIEFMRRALEMEPSNSYVAALCAHVQSIARQSYVAAFELAERSIQLNPANPLGWMCLGIAESNLGKEKIGFEHTLVARELAGTSPFRYSINANACTASCMLGDVDSAILLGEAAHGLAPTYKPPLRFLSALYFLRERVEDSQDMIEKLRLAEPNFSYDLLRDKSYPAASLQRTRLVEKLPRRQI